MKNKIGIITLAIALLLITNVSCTDGLVDYDVYGSISGTVVEQGVGPVQDVLVMLKPTGQKVYTGYDGSFEFLDLEGRQYNIWAQKDGYYSDNTTVTIVAGGNVNVKMVLRKKE